MSHSAEAWWRGHAHTIHVDCSLGVQKSIRVDAFRLRYQLHGILCDDMGLGKTLQTLCIIAGMGGLSFLLVCLQRQLLMHSLISHVRRHA